MSQRADAPKLLDVFARHQAYLEGVKVQQGRAFDEQMVLFRAEIRELFRDLPYEKLSEIPKRQLLLFIKRLRKAQIAHFNVFTQQLLNDLRKFMEIDTDMNKRIMEKTQEEDKSKLAAMLALLKPAALADRKSVV